MMVDCKRYSGPGDGSIERLEAGRVACNDNGTRIFAAQGARLITFALEGEGEERRLRREASVQAPAEIGHLTSYGAEPFLTVPEDGGATLYRLRGGRLVTFARLPTAPRQVLATAGGVFVLMPPTPGRAPEVLRLDLRTGDVAASAPVPAGVATLRPAHGPAVITVDPQRQTVRRIDLGDECDRPGAPGSGPDGGAHEPRPDTPDPKPGCRCGGAPHCCGSSEPGGVRPERPRRPPRDFCEDGGDGTEDDCFVYIAFGMMIIRYDICRPERDPCRRVLHSRIDRIERLSGTLFAITRGGRTLEALDPQNLAVRSQSALAGAGSLILTAPAAGQLISIAPDFSQVVVAQAAGAAFDLDFDLGAEISEKVVIGSDFSGEPGGPLFALQNTSVLIVPITNPAQNYTGPGNAIFRDALATLLTSPASPEAPLAKVRRYYDEQSDEQQGLDFVVFGADSPDFYTGGPIELPNNLTSYFYGDFDPGGMESFVQFGASPAEFRMRGNETRTITAISSVNDQSGSNANEFEFTLRFPAAIVRIDLDGSDTITIPTTGPDWPILYDDSAGISRTLTLEPSNLSQNFTRTFTAAGAPFTADTAELAAALAEMLAASSASGDIDTIDVVWGKRPGETRGRIYLLFRFAAGGNVPRFTSLASRTVIAGFFGVARDHVRALSGSAVFDLSDSDADQADARRLAQDYLTIVMRLAEIDEAGEAGEWTVLDPKLGSAEIATGGSAADVLAITRLRLTNTHGGGDATIEPGGGSGSDPLNLAGGYHLQGSNFPADSHNTMIDKGAFFEMLYGRIVTAVQNDLGGAPSGGWSELAEFLNGFRTVYAFPIEPPPPSSPAAWSVDGAATTRSLRAFVWSNGQTTDPNGSAPSANIRWGMNFQSFDPVAPSNGISTQESNARTFAHELGHTLGLADQYGSTKFDPTIAYVGGLDLMGSSQSSWPHLCAYHKLALGWWDTGDHLVLSPPGEGDLVTTDFILVPTEWWRSGLTGDARAAVSNGAGLPVVGAALCDLGGDGGMLATIEARAPGGEFSSDMGPDGEAGRVTILNVLDYGQNGRYGQVITDDETLPQTVIDGLMRFRRRIHRLAGNLQAGSEFDMGDAPGFPYHGILVRILEEGSITLGATAVPVYRCAVEWTGGLAADVGFADNSEEWRSSDIGIDYIGNDPNNPESGERTWPDGEPVGVGETVVIPSSGSEPHRVLVRVRNFGVQTVRNVTVDLYLRDPGGGGELDGETPFGTQVIDELLPVGVAGPALVVFPWDVPAGQEPHICWRAEVRDFQIGEGANTQVVVTDASPTNNWAQQNIFEADVVFESPPEPLESRFSVYNDGPFLEIANLVPEGLPRGVTVRIRPRLLRVPAYSRRTFSLRFEFDEELTRDPCRREMDVLMRCFRVEEHFEERWGASLFKIRLRRKTATTVGGTWFGNQLELSGQVDPPIGVGRVSIRLDFENGEDAEWINAPLSPGGTFDAAFDTGGIDHSQKVIVAARYRGTPVFAPSTSPPVDIFQNLPAG